MNRLSKFKNNTKQKIAHFSVTSNFSVDDSGHLKKQALVFVEGKHKDNQGREHELTKERLEKIANNTRAYFQSGNNIPVLKDHQRNFDSTVGDIQGEWLVRPIQNEDIADERNKNLVGKLGLFTNDVILKTKDAIEKVSNNVVKTISPGLNFVEDCIKEVSLTSTPAITGMSLFSEALTWEELQQNQKLYEQIRDHYDEISESFFQLMKNILETEDVERKEEYLMNAIYGYADKLMQLFEVNPQVEQQIYGNQIPQQPQQKPPIMGQQQQQQMGQQQMYGFNQNNKNYLAVFSLNDMIKFEEENSK